MALNLDCHWEYKPLFQKGLSPLHLLMTANACFLQRSVHTYTACGSMCNKLVILCDFSVCCYVVKGIVKKPIKGIASLPSLFQEGHCMTLWFVRGDPTSNSPLPVTSNIITWAQNTFKGQRKNSHCNKKWSFQKKINEKIDLWVASNSNSSVLMLVSSFLGSQCLHAIMLDTLPIYKDIRTETIKIFSQGYRYFLTEFHSI